MLDLARAMRADGQGGLGFWVGLVWDALSQAAAGWWWLARSSLGAVTTRRVEEPMTTLLADLRYAARRIMRQRLFSATIVFLVAVGIAGSTAVFRIVNGLFLKPLPFPAAERLADIDVEAPAWNLEFVGVAIPDFRAWREGTTTFQSMAAYAQRGANVEVDGGATRVGILAATHDIDEVIGLEPHLGRFFGPDEDVADGPAVAMLSRGFWEAQFAGDMQIVGRTLQLDGLTVEIIGVLPPEAQFLADVDLWVPLQEDDESSYYLTAVGRLRDGASIDQAREDLRAIHRAMIPQRSENDVTTPVVQDLRSRYLGQYRLSSGILLAAVGLLLLIACGNVAGLMTARSLGRASEVSLRTALGARRGRLVAQFMTESVVLAGLGAVLGTVAGVWGADALLTAQAGQFPAWVRFDLDARFVAFAVLVAGAATALFGVAPAVRGSASPSGHAGSSGRVTASRATRALLSWVVAAQVAAAAALLVVAGVAARDAHEVGTRDPGFTPADLVTWRLQLERDRYPERADRLAFLDAYTERLEALPGVTSAVLGSTLPLMGHSGYFFEVEGFERPEGELGPVVLRRWVTPNYFDAMGITLLRGRGFEPFDGRDEGDYVVVVNESFVRSHVPEGSDPIGHRIHTGGANPTLLTIVGVARDVLHYGLDQEMRPGTYEPVSQNPSVFIQAAVRAPGTGLSVVPAARAATLDLDAGLPLFDVQTMQQRLDTSLLSRRSTMWLIVTFSTAALLLAVAGLYGVVSYSVNQRTREISIRMAMGARGGAVSGQVVRQGMALAGAGLAVGLGGAFLLAGPVSGILAGGDAADPAVFAAVALLLLAVAAVANWIPARRAAALDPAGALRGD